MDGGKAEFLHEKCAQAGMAFTRFDYGGHGLSGGAFADGTIGDWYCDAQPIFDQICWRVIAHRASPVWCWSLLPLISHAN